MRDFGQIFAGRTDYYGETIYADNGEWTPGSKRPYKSDIKAGLVTQEHFDQHLDPTRAYGFGIIPVDEFGMCNWMCIDVDQYEKGRETGTLLRAKIDALGLPVIPCYSKSFGVHIFIFFKEPVEYVRAKSFLISVRDRLDLPKNVELFPKQDKIEKPTESGTFLNLPYWNGDQRCAVAKDGSDMPFDEFIQEVYAVELTLADLETVDEVLDETQEHGVAFLHEAPPCIQTMIEQGIPQGGRSNALTHLSVFAKKRAAEVDDFEWQDWINDVNVKHFQPPLPLSELTYSLRSVERSNLGYLCNQEPMQSMCDKSACAKCVFGIMSGLDRKETEFSAFRIERMKKINASPPYYMIEIEGYEGRPIKMNSGHLIAPRKFVQAAFEYLDVLFPPPTAKQLTDMVNMVAVQKEDKWTEEDAPEEMEDISSILNMLHDWIEETISPKATAEEIMSNNPIWRDNNLLFKGSSFIEHLQSRGHRFEKTKIFDALRSKRASNEWYREWQQFDAKSVTIDGQSIYLWMIPLRTKEDGGWFVPPDVDEGKAF